MICYHIVFYEFSLIMLCLNSFWYLAFKLWSSIPENLRNMEYWKTEKEMSLSTFAKKYCWNRILNRFRMHLTCNFCWSICHLFILVWLVLCRIILKYVRLILVCWQRKPAWMDLLVCICVYLLFCNLFSFFYNQIYSELS